MNASRWVMLCALMTCSAGCHEHADSATSRSTAASRSDSNRLTTDRGTTPDEPAASCEYIERCLHDLDAIKPGITRAELAPLLTTEGGLYTRSMRCYVRRDCPYVKMEIRFRPVGDAGPGEDPQDVVLEVSRPYLEWSIQD